MNEIDDTSTKFECWFLDVGQGSSNVILLGGNRAIVIDCGPKGSKETLCLLKRYVDTIEAFIITHNDEDHDGNHAEILKEYAKRINKIFFLQDRAVEKINICKSLGILAFDRKTDYPKPLRIEATDKPQQIFSEGNIKLYALYPAFVENLTAQTLGKKCPNRTSAVLKLDCGDRKVVFSSDSTIETWEAISSRTQAEKPLHCDVMTIPHHGGYISSNVKNEKEQQDKLYSQLVKPDYGIVSVGSINKYDHPTAECIESLIKAGVKVLCTQMTDKCCDDLESIRSIGRIRNTPSRSSKEQQLTTEAHRSKHVACFGSIIAEISEDQIKISQIRSYRRDIQSFAKIKGFHPVCKSAI